MDDLKPCPFCNRDAHIIDTGNYFPDAIFYRIVCESSCTMQARLYRTIEESVKAWNTREGQDVRTEGEIMRSKKTEEAIGYALSLLMEKKQISQRELAKRVGCSNTSIHRYVKGECEPRLSTLYKICDVCGEDVSWFDIALKSQ